MLLSIGIYYNEFHVNQCDVTRATTRTPSSFKIVMHLIFSSAWNENSEQKFATMTITFAPNNAKNANKHSRCWWLSYQRTQNMRLHTLCLYRIGGDSNAQTKKRKKKTRKKYYSVYVFSFRRQQYCTQVDWKQ